jgi:DNA-binding transcriptional regulator LsrR (DeoR family)
MSEQGTYQITPTGRAIIDFLEKSKGVSLTKAQIAEGVGCAEKTVDRLVKRMREEGMIEVSFNWSPTGAQLANTYSTNSHKINAK